MAKINFTPDALEDMKEIKAYITDELCSEQSTINTIEKIMKSIRQLGDFPEIGAPLASIISLTASLSAATTPHFTRSRATRFTSSVFSTADGTLCKYFSESHTTNNTRSLSFGVAIFFYPLIIVPKQKTAAAKPRETTVESVDIVPAKLHTHTAIITLVARIRINSLRTVDKKVAFCAEFFSSAVMVDSTGKPPSIATSISKCSSQGFDNLSIPRQTEHLDRLS